MVKLTLVGVLLAMGYFRAFRANVAVGDTAEYTAWRKAAAARVYKHTAAELKKVMIEQAATTMQQLDDKLTRAEAVEAAKKLRAIPLQPHTRELIMARNALAPVAETLIVELHAGLVRFEGALPPLDASSFA